MPEKNSRKNSPPNISCSFLRSIEEQIQRISLDNEDNPDSMYSSVEQESATSDPSTAPITSSVNGSSSAASTSSASSSSASSICDKSTETSKASSQTADNMVLNDLNEGSVKCPLTNSATPPLNVNITEPIYAVVNLKHKYARRAKIREEMEETVGKERPNSFHVVASDYEEVRFEMYSCVLCIYVCVYVISKCFE